MKYQVLPEQQRTAVMAIGTTISFFNTFPSERHQPFSATINSTR